MKIINHFLYLLNYNGKKKLKYHQISYMIRQRNILSKNTELKSNPNMLLYQERTPKTIREKCM